MPTTGVQKFQTVVSEKLGKGGFLGSASDTTLKADKTKTKKQSNFSLCDIKGNYRVGWHTGKSRKQQM